MRNAAMRQVFLANPHQMVDTMWVLTRPGTKDSEPVGSQVIEREWLTIAHVGETSAVLTSLGNRLTVPILSLLDEFSGFEYLARSVELSWVRRNRAIVAIKNANVGRVISEVVAEGACISPYLASTGQIHIGNRFTFSSLHRNWRAATAEERISIREADREARSRIIAACRPPEINRLTDPPFRSRDVVFREFQSTIERLPLTSMIDEEAEDIARSSVWERLEG